MSTRRAAGSLEDRLFPAASIMSLCAAAAIYFLRTRYSLHNNRLVYAFAHLPAAFLAIALFLAAIQISRRFLLRAANLETRPAALYILAIVIVFAIFWLPVYLAGGFAQDDWLLLAAASTRKLILVHPTLSWKTLDSVDGNFRPLGTVLYFGYMLKVFGLSAHAFTFGPFLLTLLATLVAFALVRELGYSKLTATAASLLFLSRGMIYTMVAWASALGDSIAILLCGLTALLILKANKRSGLAVAAFHLLAWLCFTLATLGKQSAFVTPLIVGLLLLLRPGQDALPTLARRIAAATSGLLAYVATAAFVFLHAKSLLRAPSPYLIDPSPSSLFQSFCYATWYFLVLRFPDTHPLANLIPEVGGILLLIGLLVLARRYSRFLGPRPRDVVFACLAALSSISLFVVLSTRSAPYYGSMAAFWFSIALAIAITRFSTPAARIVFCLLLVTGFAEVRVEQTGLIPSGGYLWGTFGMDSDRFIYYKMRRQLSLHPQTISLILIDCPAIPYTSMALLEASNIQRILLYDRDARIYRANDRLGLIPVDEVAGLTDPHSYNWNQPLDSATAYGIVSHETALRLACREGVIQDLSAAP